MMDEIIEGRLCEKGYLKEYYDESINDLRRVLTLKGLNEVYKLLKDPEWMKIAIMLMKENGWSEEEIVSFFMNLK